MEQQSYQETQKNEHGLRKILTSVFAVLLMSLLGGYFYGGVWASSYYFDKGEELFYAGDFSGAEAALKKSIKFNPKNPLPYAALGYFYLPYAKIEGRPADYPIDYATARDYYEKALEHGLDMSYQITRSGKSRSMYTSTLHDLASSYRNLGQYEKARETYLKKIELSPQSSFWARYRLAEMDFDRLNQPQEALEFLKPAPDSTGVDFGEIYKVYSLLARLSFYFEDYDSTIKYADLALENAPAGSNGLDARIAVILKAIVGGKAKDFSGLKQGTERAEDMINKSKSGAFDCYLAYGYFLGGDYVMAKTAAKNINKAVNDYVASACAYIVAKIGVLQKDVVLAKKSFSEYLDLVAKITPQNIFIHRYKAEAEDYLGSNE